MVENIDNRNKTQKLEIQVQALNSKIQILEAKKLKEKS